MNEKIFLAFRYQFNCIFHSNKRKIRSAKRILSKQKRIKYLSLLSQERVSLENACNAEKKKAILAFNRDVIHLYVKELFIFYPWQEVISHVSISRYCAYLLSIVLLFDCYLFP